MQGAKLSLLVALFLVTTAQASWIAGKKVVESIAGVNDIPINFGALSVTVQAPTHVSFSNSNTDVAALTAQLQTALEGHGVRENEAKHIAEWAGSSGSYESRMFEFKYVDEIGSLLVKQVTCKRKAQGATVTVDSVLSSALATCPVHAVKAVHHEKTVTRRVIGIRVKRWTERWTTHDPRGLTRAEIDQLVDLMSGKTIEAIKASKPPALQAAAPVPEESEEPVVLRAIKESEPRVTKSEDVAMRAEDLVVEINVVKREAGSFELEVSAMDSAKLTAMLQKQLRLLGAPQEGVNRIVERAVTTLVEQTEMGPAVLAADTLREFDFDTESSTGNMKLSRVVIRSKREGETVSVTSEVALAAGSCSVNATKTVHYEKTMTRVIKGIKINSWTETFTKQERRDITSEETDVLVDVMFGELKNTLDVGAPKFGAVNLLQ